MVMLICSAALSSTINSRLRRGLAYSLICDSASLTPSVVVGLLTKEKAPRASACSSGLIRGEGDLASERVSAFRDLSAPEGNASAELT